MNVLLPNINLLHAVIGEKAGPVHRAADEALQQAAVRGADHIDDVAGLNAEMAERGAGVRLHADDRRARVANRAGRAVRVGAHARRIADDVAGVADALV